MNTETILLRDQDGQVMAPATGQVQLEKKAGMKILLAFGRVADLGVYKSQEKKADAAIQSGDLESFFEVLTHLFEEGMPGSYLQGPVYNRKANVISWEGTWTKGRFVDVEFSGETCTIRWDSGTGGPSTYIGGRFSKSIGFF